MHARDVLSRPVVTVHPETTVREAITLLTCHGFAALPVVDDDGRVVGIFSESDALAGLAHLETAVVAAVMTVPVEVVAPGTEIATVAGRMLTGELRSMPVVEAGLLVGIVARSDLLRALIREDTTVESRIRALLDEYAGSRRLWTIESDEGRVTIRGAFADDTEQRVVAALARTIDGVHTVDLIDDATVAPDR